MTHKKSKNPDKSPDKSAGRPKTGMAQVEGMERFCQVWHYRLAIVKAAKKKGLPGFDAHGRVDPVRLIPALNDMIATGSELPEGIATPQDWLATEKAKREAIKRQQDEKATMLTSDACRQAAEAMSLTFAELERRDRELPPALAGLSAVEIFKRMKADTESIRRGLQAKFQEVGK